MIILYRRDIITRDGASVALAEALSRAYVEAPASDYGKIITAGVMIKPPIKMRGDQVRYEIAFFEEGPE